MKTRFYKFLTPILKKIGIILLLTTIGYSCIDNNNPAFATFTGEMIYTYLQKDTVNNYSEFVKIIDRASLKGMLSAYGAYTCLAPTNDAFKAYYRTFGPNFTIDSLRKGQIDTIAKNHIVTNLLLTSTLQDGVIPSANMNQRFIEIKFTTDSLTSKLKIMLNDSSRIISKDNEVYNGVVHGINRVLTPLNSLLPELIANNPKISIFSEALKITHLCDSLRKIKDMSYKPTKIYKDEYDTYTIINPKERKFGYTVLVEDDDVLKANGINNINDLIAKAKQFYPEGSGERDFTSRDNSLNKYISYHLINKTIFLNKFFYNSSSITNYTPDEFMETMLTNRIIKASLLSRRITLNPQSDYITSVKETGSKTTLNGVYHLLDNLLVYSTGVEQMLQNTRIRFDITSLFPEFANNNIRRSEGLMKENGADGDRFGFEPGYVDNIKMSKDTRLIYLAGKDGLWADFQSDELMGLGAYDITIRLLPVPPGTYELRFGYSAMMYRSVTQIYVDNKPIGIPLDLTIYAENPQIGWLADDAVGGGIENDKAMRNRGYMKGPNTVLCGGKPIRSTSAALRRIVGTFTFTEYGAHELRFKSVLDDNKKQCMMDYFEFVPKSIYNPSSGEPESQE